MSVSDPKDQVKRSMEIDGTIDGRMNMKQEQDSQTWHSRQTLMIRFRLR